MRLVLLAMVLVALTSCVVDPWRTAERPWTAASVEGAADAWVAFASGEEVVVAEPQILGEGAAMRLVGRVGTDRREVLLADVVELQTRRTETLRVIGNVVLGTAAVAVVVGAVALGARGDFGFDVFPESPSRPERRRAARRTTSAGGVTAPRSP